MSDRQCGVDGCIKPHLARGFCNTHYAAAKRTGQIEKLAPAPQSRPCIVDGCDKMTRRYKRMCVMHIARLRRHGSVDGFADRPDAVQRILRMVDFGECWIWTGHANAAGYGVLRLYRPDMNVLVYKYLYEALVGPVADGMVLDHRCRNVLCVFPEHLRQVTNKQNTEHFTKMLQSNNTTGYRGVVRMKSGRFMAHAKHLGKQHYGGTWATPEEAGEAAKRLRLTLHTHNELDR